MIKREWNNIESFINFISLDSVFYKYCIRSMYVRVQSCFIGEDSLEDILESEVDNIADLLLRSNIKIYNVSLYKSDIEKVSFIFFNLIKNHYLRNGNKRMACICVFYILYEVGYATNYSMNILYEKTIEVSESKSKDFDIIKDDLSMWFNNGFTKK